MQVCQEHPARAAAQQDNRRTKKRKRLLVKEDDEDAFSLRLFARHCKLLL
jgi:hypothetical protein